MVQLQANIRKEQLLNSKLGVDFYVHVRLGPMQSSIAFECELTATKIWISQSPEVGQ